MMMMIYLKKENTVSRVHTKHVLRHVGLSVKLRQSL